MTQEAAVVTPSTREQLKSMTDEEFAKAHKKAELVEIAEGLKIEIEPKASKMDLAALIRTKYPLPDATLRGVSAVDSPVQFTWAYAHNSFAAAAKAKEPAPRRKDVVNECIEAGVAYYTARTQYQAWFKHTSGGENMISGNEDGLPKGLAVILGFAKAEAAPEKK